MNLRKKIKGKKENWLIAYKLSSDALFWLSIFLFLLVFSEGILPRAVTQHISFFVVVSLVGFLVLFNFFLVGAMELEFKKQLFEKKAAIFFLFGSAVVFFNGLWKINIFLNLFVTALSLFCVFWIFRVMEEE